MNRVLSSSFYKHCNRAIHQTIPKHRNETQLQTAGPVASLIKSRSVIRFRGPDTVKFLQGLLTNDIRKFGEPIGDKTANFPTPNVPTTSVTPIYAALLTPQGRFLYDLFLYKPPNSDTKLDTTGTGPASDPNQPFELFADVDASVLDELLATFTKYRLRSKVEIDNVASEFSCWQRYGSGPSDNSSDVEEPEAASVGWGAGEDGAAMSSSSEAPLIEADKETDEQNYLMWRIEKGVAEGSIEIPKGEAMPLEYNLVGLNAISFDKGCYVGQELIARTHHRGVIRKRLVPLRFQDNDGKEVIDKVIPGSEVVNRESGKKAGLVTTALGCRGLGLLRLEEALKGSTALSIQGQEDVKVVASKPDWWPSDWLQDLQQHTAFA
ncbi:putative transferase At4g12130, mitochondrial isoform X3 [Trifolium pratense]|uniref:Uncharacterized protein n=1 Tax=Trifolium pratense TaxID=57577 RepID=A0ACB0KQ72_TRIPR|nr:putative transferase At4g12130, mitochondrial isoform X3 [Trifolium pratense]XP_045803986.1 putative transferase At4g12130, mitochondrial isoform X3 [Trifolium pratense]XP_045803987.1 putative transferase At4g12130, mitochondrial isoform X3 [Trifolium pratense]XP_045803988.1 putative transferase At4g12130, mitochondrial isoform X3 [Trifolium pratense]CAJ2659321.1 unnamed protein product [Trifolium pratense]